MEGVGCYNTKRKWNGMLYCDKCQILSEDEETCPLCGNRRLRPVAANDPVLLFTTWNEEAQRIAAAFDDDGIPHMERVEEGGGASPVLLGRNRCAQIRIFVPFSEIGHARDVMRGIGALKDDGKDDRKLSEKTAKAAPKDMEKPMSPGKQAFVRILSILMFLLLVCAVVFGADAIVGGFKSIFH